MGLIFISCFLQPVVKIAHELLNLIVKVRAWILENSINLRLLKMPRNWLYRSFLRCYRVFWFKEKSPHQNINTLPSSLFRLPRSYNSNPLIEETTISCMRVINRERHKGRRKSSYAKRMDLVAIIVPETCVCVTHNERSLLGALKGSRKRLRGWKLLTRQSFRRP